MNIRIYPIRLWAIGSTMLTAALLGEASHAEMREFKSAQGSVIRAELKKAKGQTILLKSDQGKELAVPLKSFSADDQLFILKWISEDPTAMDHTFTVKITEKEAGDKKDKTKEKDPLRELGRMLPGRAGFGLGLDTESTQKRYEINLTSSTRAPLADLSIDWCAFMLDKVRGRDDFRGWPPGGPRGFGRPNEETAEDPTVAEQNAAKGTLRAKRGNKLISKMDYLQSELFETSTFNIDSSSSPKSTDKLVGLWLRVYRGETMVFEWKSPTCPKTEWPGGAHKGTGGLIASTKTEPSKTPTPIPTPSEPPAPVAEPAKSATTAEDEELIIKIFELGDSKE